MQDEDVVEVSAADLHSLAEFLQTFSGQLRVSNELNTIQFSLPKGTANLEEVGFVSIKELY